MTEKTSPQTAAHQRLQVRRELFTQTGWVFVTADVLPELEELGVVQKFASASGPYVHQVQIEHCQLRCTCPGWRKYAKCWHVRWVLENSISSNWTIGTFVDRMPLVRELAELDAANGWSAWLKEHIAVVAPEKGAAGLRLVEVCNECGGSVAAGSGRLVNRALDLNLVSTRAKMGKPFPLGDFVCAECENRPAFEAGRI